MIIQGDALSKLKELETESIDLICTDPPYGYSFMNKDWDKAVVGVDTWKECLRVLKAGAFAFIMSSPRQDVLCKMMLNLIDAGFRTDFSSIYWAYASGFPKAADVSKLVDKRGYENHRYSELSEELCDYLKISREKAELSQKDVAKHFLSKTGGITGCVWNWENGANIPTLDEWNKLKQILKLDNTKFNDLIERAILKREEAEREVIGKGQCGDPAAWYGGKQSSKLEYDITKPATEQAKKLEGAYAGCQMKPAVELVLIVMKPLSEKSYVDQALSNGKGVTWLDDCRIPYQNEDDIKDATPWNNKGTPWSTNNSNEGWKREAHKEYTKTYTTDKGRFPANLLCEDDILNDGRITKSRAADYNWTPSSNDNPTRITHNIKSGVHYGDEGSFSRYFDLDAWWAKTLPFLITPKASKQEKNKGLSGLEEKTLTDGRKTALDYQDKFNAIRSPKANYHPTVKPQKLMSYLITMGSREGDTVLDPFAGSGTTLIAAHQLHRKYIGIELNPEYCEIARKRLEPYQKQAKLL